MSVTFRPGWVPTPAGRPRVRMTDSLREGVAPSSVNYSQVPLIGMHLNDDWGDCTIAADANIIQQQTYYGQGSEVVVPDSTCLLAYEVVGNFNPNDGPPGDNPTDNGALIPDALDYIKKTGMAGHKIAAYGDVQVGQVEKVKTAVNEFGAVSIGVNLPNSAMTQFADTKVFTYDPTLDNSIAGGHCMCLCGYNTSGFLAWTWDAVVLITWSWWAHFTEEAWPVVSYAWVNEATGKDPEGVDMVSLGREFQAETGQNPFPPRGTQPPAPKPAPHGSPDPLAAVRPLMHRLLGWLRRSM